MNLAHKYVYLFSEGSKDMRNLLGGKGANLAEMTNLGMPVPQGFTITTEACIKFYDDGEKINDEILAEIDEYVEKLQKMSGKKFGDLNNPLLVSVRSGARASMPGMMDTILNLGLTPWWKPLPGRPAIPALPMTPIVGSSRCIPTWSWRWARSTSRSSSTR